MLVRLGKRRLQSVAPTKQKRQGVFPMIVLEQVPSFFSKADTMLEVASRKLYLVLEHDDVRHPRRKST
jgi:hypothetical protein